MSWLPDEMWQEILGHLHNDIQPELYIQTRFRVAQVCKQTYLLMKRTHQETLALVRRAFDTSTSIRVLLTFPPLYFGLVHDYANPKLLFVPLYHTASRLFARTFVRFVDRVHQKSELDIQNFEKHCNLILSAPELRFTVSLNVRRIDLELIGHDMSVKSATYNRIRLELSQSGKVWRRKHDFSYVAPIVGLSVPKHWMSTQFAVFLSLFKPLDW